MAEYYNSGQAINIKDAIDIFKDPLGECVTQYNDAFTALDSLHPETKKQGVTGNKVDVSFITEDYNTIASNFASKVEDMASADAIKSRDPDNGFQPVKGEALGESQTEASALADETVEEINGTVEGEAQSELSAAADGKVVEVLGYVDGTAQTEASAQAEPTIEEVQG